MSKKQFINIHNFTEDYIGGTSPIIAYDMIGKKTIQAETFGMTSKAINELFNVAHPYEILTEQYVHVRGNLYDVGVGITQTQSCIIFLQNNSKIYTIEYSWALFTSANDIYLAKGYLKAFIVLIYTAPYTEIISYSIVTQRYP